MVYIVFYKLKLESSIAHNSPNILVTVLSCAAILKPLI